MTVQSAHVPDTMATLTRRNEALCTLNACLEREIALHREKAGKYHEAVATLESEREANRVLTEDLEALRAAMEERNG